MKAVIEDVAAGNIEEEEEDDEANKGKERVDETKYGGEAGRKQKALREKLRLSAITALGNAFPSSSADTQKKHLEEHYRFFTKHALASVAVFQVPLLQALSRCLRVLLPSSSSDMDVDGGEAQSILLSPNMVQDILSACWSISADTKVCSPSLPVEWTPLDLAPLRLEVPFGTTGRPRGRARAGGQVQDECVLLSCANASALAHMMAASDTELMNEELVNQIKVELERAREDTSQLVLIQAILTLLQEHSNTPPPTKRTRLSPRV